MNFFGFDRHLMVDGLGKARKGKGKGKARRARRARPGCKRVTFKRARKGGKVLPRSQWKTVTRCPGKKLKATNRKQCRRGGTGPAKHLFVKCPPGKSTGYIRPVRRAA